MTVQCVFHCNRLNCKFYCYTDLYLVVRQCNDWSSIIKDRLNIPIDELDIQRSHRLGPPNSKRPLRSNKKKAPRPIIVKFTNYKKRKEVYSSKKKLKGQGIVISENLTVNRYKIYQAAILKFDRKIVWSNEGRIFANINGNIVVISSMEDLDKY